MKSKKWLLGWGLIVGISLVIVAITVFKIDPFFHYHKPDTNKYFYELNNQRSQNDGIVKHFDYDAIITGTSLTENFKTSELDELFGTNSIKISTSGASYKEINDNLARALETNPNIKMIVRGLDLSMLIDNPDRLRTDLGEYPDYLYDDNPFNDVKYLFNKDVVFGRVYPMIRNSIKGEKSGITSFDEYSRWQDTAKFGIKTVSPEEIEDVAVVEPYYMNDHQKESLIKNITQNVTDLADKYPKTEFYYFLAPYSILWYKDEVASGQIGKDIEAEKAAIELMLKQPNIKLFGFSTDTDIIMDMNNYKDMDHFASWINSYILRCMKDNTHRITSDNYEEYLTKEFELVSNFKYSELNNQVDFEDDNYEAALWNSKIWKVLPIDVIKNNNGIKLEGFEIIEEGLKTVSNKSHISIDVSNIGKHNYLVITYKGLLDGNSGKVTITSNNDVIDIDLISNDDNNYRQQVIDLSHIEGDINVSVDITNNNEVIISNIVLY